MIQQKFNGNDLLTIGSVYFAIILLTALDPNLQNQSCI